MDPLPVDEYLPFILNALGRARAVVVTAAPGAGKTTRVPPALVETGPVILLQPRRVAARAIARRIAAERGWSVGTEVGWQVRFERRFGPHTRLLVATEGILTARLQRDPLLSEFGTVVIDEFHERSLHADLAIALTKQAWRARSDLRVVVMSATLDAEAVSRYLAGCPVVAVPGRSHPIHVEHLPGGSAADAVQAVAARSGGDILCFLPGAFEIRQALAEVRGRFRSGAVEALPLYGSQDAADQDRVLQEPPPGRRVILATNIAETSVTVPRVAAVVDTGLHKVARYDAARGVDRLVTERITADSAEQRAGRAGRLGPGIAIRLWDARTRLRPVREPELRRVDLAGLVLDVLMWGGEPGTLDWFEPPAAARMARAVALLERLGALERGRLTAVGRDMARFPLHPRLARIMLEGPGGRDLARACALIAERRPLPRAASVSTTSDLISALDEWDSMPAHLKQVAREIERLVEPAGRPAATEAALRRAVVAGYPTGSHNAASRVLVGCDFRMVRVRSSEPRAACVTASFWSRSTSWAPIQGRD